MSDYYVGEIRLFAGRFAPEGWALCDGQLLSVTDNQALFSLLGTTYGGNGVNDFGVPDLRGRLVCGIGKGEGLSTEYVLGQAVGAGRVSLQPAEMPAHNHVMAASPEPGNSTSPKNAVYASVESGATGGYTFYVPTGAAGNMERDPDANLLKQAGGNQPHDNVMPSLAITYIIALNGLYPQPAN